MAWFEALVWPGQERRVQCLRAAIEIARADPPKARQGNLLTDIPAIAALSPKNTQLVVYHAAGLSYVSCQPDRDEFAKTVRQIGTVWISNEALLECPELAKTAPPPPSAGCFLRAVDPKPIAWTGPHGQSSDWFTR